MAAVIAFHRLAAGRNDFRPSDAETTAVTVAPVTVDRIGEAGSNEKQRGDDRTKAFEQLNKHDLRPPRLKHFNLPLLRRDT